MKNNKYQKTGIKGRLLHPGFVTCYLFIALLYACNGGYEPEVGGEDVIIPEYVKDTHMLAGVYVKIPKKITEDIVNGKEDRYLVQWNYTGSVSAYPIDKDYPLDKETINFSEQTHIITITTVFVFNTLSSPITIEVYKCLPNDTGALVPRGLVATKKDIPIKDPEAP